MSDSTIDDSRAIDDRVPESTRLASRYVKGALLGEGGMGEVRECRDRVLDRKVGLKLVRRDRVSRDLEARFVREACVQAQLEHPGVVPVYEVGRAETGAAFFTMRKVDGLTLDDVLERKRNRDPETEATFTRHRLLTAFAQICLTVDYAHSRGVLHRDVKPANVMFGDFGEVYVLDWGVAKLTSIAERDLDSSGATGPHLRIAQTEIGATVGTPAYMAPEQMAGATLDPRTDVFALGCLLFEILTLEPLFDEATTAARLGRRKVAWDARPSVRASGRNVPPEFDRICVRATADAVDKRYPSARALHDAVEAYLGGERDLELRRHKAADLLDGAEKKRLTDPDGALHDVNRALALAPGEPRGLVLLVHLLEETPGAMERARSEVVSASIARLRRHQPLGALLFTVPWLTMYPASLLIRGARSVWLALVPLVAWLATGIAMFIDHRFQTQEKSSYPTWLTGIALACTTVLFGPFYILPALALTVIANHVLISARPLRPLVVTLGCLAIVVPFVLAALGVHDVYRFADGSTFRVNSVFREVRGERIAIVLTVTHALVVLATCLFTAGVRDEIERARHEGVLVAWHLARLLPAEIGTPAPLVPAGGPDWDEADPHGAVGAVARILDTAIDDAPRAGKTIVQPTRASEGSAAGDVDERAPSRDPLVVEGPRYVRNGDVWRDVLIQRDVVLERVRSPQEVIRHARLDHPGVPPIYDLGEDAEGIWYTRKPVTGISLADARRAELGRHRTLAAFMQVCLTLDYAHARGVVHGGLDASRVVLGDFGEVWVVGWGARDGKQPAPEQLGGKEPDARADVFALGAMLYEVLVGEPLVPGDRREIVLGRYDARPSARGTTDVPVELDEICVKATAYEPSDRYASARELHDAIEGFLGADRDVVLRRRLAAEHIARAESHDKEGDREAALRELGRALALAPDRSAAVEMLGRLLASPPAQVPSDVAIEIEQQRIDATMGPARITAIGYAITWLAAFPTLAVLAGVRDGWAIVIVMSAWALAAAALFAQRQVAWAALTSFLAAAATSLLFGPYVIVPAIAVAMSMGQILGGPLRYRPLVIALAVASVVVPAVLAMTNILDVGGFAPARGGVLVIVKGALHHSPNGLYIAVGFAALATLVIGAMHAARHRDLLERVDATNRARILALSRLVQPAPPK